MDFKDKKIAIAGFGIEGKSSLEYFQKHGAEVTVLDENPEVSEIVPEGVAVRSGGAAFPLAWEMGPA